MSAGTDGRWYDDVKEITERLVGIPSVSPGDGERECAEVIHGILKEGGLSPNYWPIPHDKYKRTVVWAMVNGSASARDHDGRTPTVVLIGHLDTVHYKDYAPSLRELACKPLELEERLCKMYKDNPDTDDELLHAGGSGKWAFGRGCLDMKSGIAAQIAVMETLARNWGSLHGNVIIVVTPDEENESAGILEAVEGLVKLREEHKLRYVGVINSDYTSPREPGDENRYIYRGTIGKLLPCFYIRGRVTHVGEAFRGFINDFPPSS